MDKRILVVCQRFWPENNQINDICEGFIERGYEVDVLCGQPNYPSGEFYKGYNSFGPGKEEHGKLQNRIAAFERIAGKNKSVHLTMVTTCGLAHNTYWNDVQSEVVLDDLFREVR